MTKVLHCADIHLGDLRGPVRDGRNARREDTLRCMDAIADAAARERPDLSVVAGDLFNRSKVWADTALADIDDAVTRLIRPLCEASGQVALLFGTQTHDNPKAFANIGRLAGGIGLANLHIYTAPAVETLETGAGPVQVIAMPGFDKGRLRVFAPDADAETENRDATALVNEIVLGLAARAGQERPEGAPSILMAHYTVAGCESESGQTFLAGQDVVLLPQTIDAAGVTLACLGHIHKPQRIRCLTPAYYCGSPNQLTFNDEGARNGFYVHEIEGGEVGTRQIATPCRRHLTVRMSERQVGELIGTGHVSGIPEGAAGAIVRVIYRATPEQEKALDRAALQAELLQGHSAFHVAGIRRDEGLDALPAGAEAGDSPTDALHAYLMARKDAGSPITDGDIRRMEGLAAPIIQAADGGREAQRRAGALTPLRIEVTNYRSYEHEEFDFTGVSMAVVNGRNGAGKSSLFMDAIADCLYEQGREGPAGEWLRVGEKKGSIILEIEAGGEQYRVARTRTASGKGTLALARRKGDGDEWEGMGGATMRQTQEAINGVVGMDCRTFCSVALIRQDAYGLFLEAGSDQRMEVLSGILGLGVYGRAEEIAKEKAAGERREIARASDRMAVLDEQMRQRDGLEAELKEARGRKDLKAAQAEAAEARIKAAEREEALRQEKMRQADGKAREADRLDALAAEKEAELAGKEAERDEASALAAMSGKAAKAAETVSAARARLEELARDEADLSALAERRNALTGAVTRLSGELGRIARDRQGHEELLAQRDAIVKAAAEIEAVRKRREGLAPRIKDYDAAAKELAAAKQRITDFLADSRVRIGKMESQVEAAEKKAALLASSGCPIAENAGCVFLTDAVKAEAALEPMTMRLEDAKARDREAYEEMAEEANAAQARLEEMGDPMAESAELDRREREAAPMAALAGRLEAAQGAIAKLDEEAREKERELGDAESDLGAAEAAMEPLKRSAEEAARLRDAIREAEPDAAMQSRCAAAEATAKALAATIGLLAEDAGKARREADLARREAQEMRDGIPASDGRLEALRAEREAAADEAEELAHQIGGLQAMLAGIEDARVQWEEYRDRKGEAARRLSDYQALAEAFGLDGIQHAIVREAVPGIQARANAILSEMTGGKMAVELRTERVTTTKRTVNALDVWITGLGGASRPYASHSGGEKVKIALAVTLALAETKATSAGVRLGMLFIDEPPFLDGDGTQAYCDALEAIRGRYGGIKVMAITHDPTMKARFPQSLDVVETEHGSKVVY